MDGVDVRVARIFNTYGEITPDMLGKHCQLTLISRPSQSVVRRFSVDLRSPLCLQ